MKHRLLNKLISESYSGTSDTYAIVPIRTDFGHTWSLLNKIDWHFDFPIFNLFGFWTPFFWRPWAFRTIRAEEIEVSFTEDDRRLKFNLLDSDHVKVPRWLDADVSILGIDVSGTDKFGFDSDGNAELKYRLNPETGKMVFKRAQFDVLSEGETAVIEITYLIETGWRRPVENVATVTITGVNDAPVADTINGLFTEDSIVGETITLLDPQFVSDVDNALDDLNVVDLTIDAMTCCPDLAQEPVPYDQQIAYRLDEKSGELVLLPGQFDFLQVGQFALLNITYDIADPAGGEVSNTVTVTVTGVNDAPVADTINGLFTEDSIVGETITLLDPQFVSDVDNALDELNVVDLTIDAMTCCPDLAQEPVPYDQQIAYRLDEKSGELVLLPGQFDFLQVGQFALLNITYDIADPAGGEVSNTVTVTVTGVNDAPVADTINGLFTEDSIVGETITLLDPQFVSDVDNALDELNVVDLTIDAMTCCPDLAQEPVPYDQQIAYRLDEKSGELVLLPGQFDFLQVGQFALLNITYDIADPAGGEVSNTVTVTVTGVNDAPVADTINGLFTEDSIVGETITLLDPQFVSDVDNALDELNVVDLTIDAMTCCPDLGDEPVPYLGQLDYEFDRGTGELVFAKGQFDFLQSGQFALLNIIYDIADPAGGEVSNTMTITVTGVNDAPLADTINAILIEDSVLGETIALLDPQFVSDPESRTEALTASNVTLSGLTFLADQSDPIPFDLSPNEYFFNEQTGEFVLISSRFESLGRNDQAVLEIEYQISDPQGATANNFASVTITGENDAPTPCLTCTINLTELQSDQTIELLDPQFVFDIDGDDVSIADNSTPVVRNAGLRSDGELVQAIDADSIQFRFEDDGFTLAPDQFEQIWREGQGDEIFVTVEYMVTDLIANPVANTLTISISNPNPDTVDDLVF